MKTMPTILALYNNSPSRAGMIDLCDFAATHNLCDNDAIAVSYSVDIVAGLDGARDYAELFDAVSSDPHWVASVQYYRATRLPATQGRIVLVINDVAYLIDPVRQHHSEIAYEIVTLLIKHNNFSVDVLAHALRIDDMHQRTHYLYCNCNAQLYLVSRALFN